VRTPPDQIVNGRVSSAARALGEPMGIGPRTTIGRTTFQCSARGLTGEMANGPILRDRTARATEVAHVLRWRCVIV
jgi:hypothetical protein